MAFKDKAQASKYVYQYTKETYDRISLTVAKGDKVTIKAAADSAGVSVNAWINEAIQAKLEGKQQ